ncbi:IS66 family transposase [Bacteroides acidifaciens]|uniref:IS66 family transposase n=1 Tax=Bacteroides acidifaciens TaxID=85831 RepID=UPI000ACEF66B|nr:IS66 family transposase [Bacteroides acidifaciens]MCR2000200.1 IS66 family transposase [Bacteroides acidifaciens]
MSDEIAIFVSVKQQVNDINSTLAGLLSELKELRGTIDSLYAENRSLNRNIDKLLKENRELRKRLEKYEQPPKNSGNSSTPPSKEPIKAEVERRTKSLRKKSERPVGGQSGHEGTTRKKVEMPDEIQEVSSRYCSECGRDLSGVEGELDYVSQEIDLPQIQPIYRERRFYKKVCSCGCCNRDYAPRRRGGNAITFGKNIRAIATYLSVVQCMPYERLQSLFETMFNVRISQGTLANIVREMLEKSRPAIALIERMIKASAVVGFDESGCYTNGKLNWSWIAQTTYLTLVFRGAGRGAKVLEERFGDSLKNMVAVTDRHSAYFAIDFLNNQICLVHLLRNLEYLNDIDKKQTWAKDVQTLLRGAIHLRNEKPDEVIPKDSWLTRLDELLKKNLDSLRKEFNELKRGIIRCRDYIFNFLENPAIPSDNNASERGIRKLKVKQKISGCFRSGTGADAFHALHSIADTAWKNGQSPLDAILALV